MDVNDILDGNINRHWHHNRWAKDAVSSQRGNSIRIREPARYRVSVEQGKVSAACNRLGYRTPGVDKYKNKSIANDVLISLKPDGFYHKSSRPSPSISSTANIARKNVTANVPRDSLLAIPDSVFLQALRLEPVGKFLVADATPFQVGLDELAGLIRPFRLPLWHRHSYSAIAGGTTPDGSGSGDDVSIISTHPQSGAAVRSA